MMVTTGAKLLISLFFVGALYTTDAQITGWTVPLITGAADGTGTLTFPEDQTAGAATTTTFAAATTSGAIASYTLTAGTPFSVASGTGVLTLDTALDYETTTSYTLVVTVADNNTPPNTGIATITVTVTNVFDVAPVFASTQNAATVPDASTAGTAVKTVTATDSETGDTITYSITAGDTNSHFTIGASTGAITVNTGVTLSASTLAGYSLTVTATDSASLTHTTTVWIAVLTCSSGSVLVVASLITLLAALLTTML